MIVTTVWQFTIDPTYKGMDAGPQEISIASNTYVDFHFYAAYDQIDEIDLHLILPENCEQTGIEKTFHGFSNWRIRIYYQIYDFEAIKELKAEIRIQNKAIIYQNLPIVKVISILEEGDNKLALAPPLIINDKDQSLYYIIILLIVLIFLISFILFQKKRKYHSEPSIIDPDSLLNELKSTSVSDELFLQTLQELLLTCLQQFSSKPSTRFESIIEDLINNNKLDHELSLKSLDFNYKLTNLRFSQAGLIVHRSELLLEAKSLLHDFKKMEPNNDH